MRYSDIIETRRLGAINLKNSLPNFQIDQMGHMGLIDGYELYTQSNQTGQGTWYVLFHGQDTAYCNLFIDKILYGDAYMESKISYAYPNYINRNLMSRLFWYVAYHMQQSILCDNLMTQAAFSAVKKIYESNQLGMYWINKDHLEAKYDPTTVDQYLEDPITSEPMWRLIVKKFSEKIIENNYQNHVSNFNVQNNVQIFEQLSGLELLTEDEIFVGYFSQGQLL
jgi:hypothetical protein